MAELPDQAKQGELLLYQTEDGKTRVQLRIQGETAWLPLNQMAELFQRDKSVISKHIRNIFDEGELIAGQLLQILQQFKKRAPARSNAISSTSTWMSSSP